MSRQIRYPELAKVEPGSTLPQGDYVTATSAIDCDPSERARRTLVNGPNNRSKL
jgi:hypothetical protein